MKNTYKATQRLLGQKEENTVYTHRNKIRQPDDYRLAGPSTLRSSESRDISTPGVTTAAVVF